ncbi:MAG: orotate phosphoribosyltransferase, orotate phosphoribosyltransferase [Candidatus Peregrinibacteria bacterium GW2011_GWF2_33_10]|nr:MAG: orotate phosphoribosyltransferase, orotate phosphoribosyltransferase [Candidatus Peregrinibacteria bacterium GW2011_GWF2_33_10]OGJ45156.1 MAG: orotate phosphoribosyltransferase [Candidatus Peregrinibacteria bacterium RIFOXYA2_FULL_33_21]OGJ46304.1 MAG: orotate phosphoribosyltransferase [Candidatus Peregrinibacteria bacterium RIFOXYA12_FULL_33_12]OGJ50825.1 MAG: orotate phosphoribosyltransferase [Candidatus Peregrinibacteria bacterium RIFOXYB2_FULL_33_20]
MDSKLFAEILLRTQSVKVSTNPPFTYTSGIKSPIYCDNRRLISFVEERKQVVKGFKELIVNNNLNPSYLAGTATAAIPWAAFLAYEMDLPMVYVRPEPKAHGTGKQIEGVLPEGAKVLVVEDLVSTGGSSIKTAKVIRNEGKSEVIGVVSIMTYQMPKANQGFNEANLNLKTLTNFEILMNVAKNSGALSEADYKLAIEWNKDPENWGTNFKL